MLSRSKSIALDSVSTQQNRGDAPAPGNGRIPVLDGLRGLLAAMVIVSHYFGEVPNGVPGLAFGWIAVTMFFVLSGFLIGRIVIEKHHFENFFLVFYVRRLSRIMPAYIATLIAVRLAIDLIDAAWLDESNLFPLWAYIVFAQGIFMAAADSAGVHWLAPTWSLAVEEHFYLLAPLLMVFAPRRHLVPILLAVAGAALALRVAVFGFAISHEVLSLLPTRADVLVCGLLAAIACNGSDLARSRLMPLLRATPILALVTLGLLPACSTTLFYIVGPLVVALGCTAYLLALIHGAPEAARLDSRLLRAIGRNGFCLYLTHQFVLGLMHGLILDGQPGLASPQQWAVTLASLPVCGLVGWGMTTFIEQPVSRIGRSLRWQTTARAPAVSGQSDPPADLALIAGAKG